MTIVICFLTFLKLFILFKYNDVFGLLQDHMLTVFYKAFPFFIFNCITMIIIMTLYYLLGADTKEIDEDFSMGGEDIPH